MSHFTKLSLLVMSMLLVGPAVNAQFFFETFAEGLPADWTTVEVVGNGTATANWFYTNTGPAGQFPTAPLESTSANDGWMIFDSDLNCNQGIGQDAWLISPSVDATGQRQVVLIFQTLYRRFQDKAFVRVGSDMNDLDSWASVEVFPEAFVNDFGGEVESNPGLNPQFIQIDLTDMIDDVSNFHFAFQYESSDSTTVSGDKGCDYSWQIDDVALTQLDNDITFTTPFVFPNVVTPLSQADSVVFGVQINNPGTADQQNISVDVLVEQIVGDNRVPVYEYNEVIDEIKADSAVVLVADDLYVPQDTGVYTYTYSQTDNSNDENPGNNTFESFFVIGQTLFSKDDLSNPTDATQPQSVNGDNWEIGNYYVITTDGYVATEATFSFASLEMSHVGQTINIFLYEIDEEDDGVFDNDDVNVIGFNSYTFTDQDQNFDEITVPLLDLDGEEGVALAEGEYLIMVAYLPDMFVPYTNNRYFVNIGTVVNNGDWFLGGFGDEVTAIVRMRIDQAVSTKAPLLADEQFTLYPNPVDENLNVSFDLKQASDVDLKIFDMKGTVIGQRRFDSVIRENFQWNVRALPAGTYLLNITADEGVKTERFTVQH